MSKLKSFFSSTWFRCISVLLVLSIVLSGTLAILNDVLYVSAKERTDRAIKKIYNDLETIPTYDTIIDADRTIDGAPDKPIDYDFDNDQNIDGQINKIYVVGSTEEDHDMLFQAVGFKGYKGGSITLWVKVRYTTDGNKTIEKVILQDYDKQTLMSKLDGSFYNRYAIDVTDAYKQGKLFTTQGGQEQFTNPVSGATYSANAGNNAVNCILAYIGGIK